MERSPALPRHGLLYWYSSSKPERRRYRQHSSIDSYFTSLRPTSARDLVRRVHTHHLS